uniref:ApaG domain-containing protein n=1 Tax=Tetradesmus obliquus TaxID=3088 RepID=A0A383VN65_TETOB
MAGIPHWCRMCCTASATRQREREQLDGALATLRLLSSRLAALSGMAHKPHSSCSSDPGLTIGTKSWLLPHRIEDQRYWQYGYELRYTHSSEEPLQLLNKTWQVTELSGVLRSRSSSMLLGMQPVIYSGDSVAFKSAIILDNIKVAALALTPTQQQYSDKHYMPTDMLRPSAQPHQQQAAEGADAAPQSEKQHLEHGTASAATAASWKSML